MKRNVYEELKKKESFIAVIGLGYVGLPIAVAFAEKGLNVFGIDNDVKKIKLYKSGIDPTNEVGDGLIENNNLVFTTDFSELKRASFVIVAVPTPVNDDHTPDLTPIISASEIVGKNMSAGSVVVYESTVYPGVTEDVCVPILERESGFKCGEEFKVGYSPERINPGDKKHRLSTITKVVSGIDDESLDVISKVYQVVVDADVYKTESIKVAEAAKVIENSQRDINIAFMNELSIIFDKMGIDTKSVLEAAETKWNFLKFYPGLVGGHCIGVDPYYLTYKAEIMGYHSQIILSGRRVNDSMGKHIAEKCVKLLIVADRTIKNAHVAILGFTFKENCPDTRNTKVMDIISELRQYGIEPKVYDPVADKNEAERLYSIQFTELKDMESLDAIIVAVAHDEFKNMSIEAIYGLYKENGSKIILDVKGIYDRKKMESDKYVYWRL